MFYFLQKILPKNILSRLAGSLANCENSLVKNYLINFAIKKFGINLEEAEIKDSKSYKSFNHFFTRKLDLKYRPIDKCSNAIISPADGTITSFGNINDTKFIKAKNNLFNIENLIVSKNQIYSDFCTIYLSPKDYHRVHIPLDGILLSMTYVPGTLFSVNQSTTLRINNILSLNERLVCQFKTSVGSVAVIFVGAMLVAGIVTKWHKLVTPNYYKKVEKFNYPKNHISFLKGDEIGHFNFGSTVIVMFEKNKIFFDIKKNKIKFGERIGVIK